MKKHTTYSAVVAIVATLAIAGAFALWAIITPSNNPAPTQNPPVTKDEALAAIADAEKARTAGEFDKATRAYQRAREYYATVSNTEKVADIDAMLSLIDAEKQHAPVIEKPRMAGQE